MGQLDFSGFNYTAVRARGKCEEDQGDASRSSSHGHENAKAREYGDIERRKGVSHAFQISALAPSFPARNTASCCDKFEGDMDPCHGLTLKASFDRRLGSRGKTAK